MHELAVILLLHDLVDRLSAEEYALDVDGLHLVPMLEGDLVNAHSAGKPRIVDPDIDPAEDILHILDLALEIIEIGHVEVFESRGIALRIEVIGNSLTLFAVDICDNYACAELLKSARDRLADALTRACYNGDLAFY